MDFGFSMHRGIPYCEPVQALARLTKNHGKEISICESGDQRGMFLRLYRRLSWIIREGLLSLPIEVDATIGDCHTVTLISKQGSIDWFCFPTSTQEHASPRCWELRTMGIGRLLPPNPFEVFAADTAATL
jgi:hypothetical protein